MQINNGKDIWLDRLGLNQMPIRPKAGEIPICPISTIKAYGERGYQSVISTDFLDVWEFQQDTEGVEKLIKEGYLKVELECTPSEMTSKHYFWTSFVFATEPAKSFEEAIAHLQNKWALGRLAEIAEKYGFPKGTWEKDAGIPEPINEAFRERIGLDVWASMSDILEQCRGVAEHENLFKAYNDEHNVWLARKHGCRYVLKVDGELEEIA